MGKPDFKSPRPRSALTKTRPIIKSKTVIKTRATANVRVIVRVRPQNEKEQGDNSRQVIKIVDDQVLIFDPKVNSQGFFYHGVEQKCRDLLRKANKDLQFMFDRVFGFESTNEQIFESSTKNLITNLMDGCNCSVFAYGATGAGKTFTMIGNPKNPGITYLTMAELFQVKDTLQDERNFELGISYIEVYNELVQDLLNPGKPLQLREDGRYGVMVSGIKIHKIENPEELFALLEKGNANRTQHPTDANAESSRSHAVFQVYIQMEFKNTREVRAAKLSLIDLAGSERGSATGYVGARFAEGANINKSLLALGNCINNLADGQKYIPYRDSKLTRLLKDSLGGNCQTVMIANVSPSSLTYDDTYNTLKYATRAKKIKSEVKKNVINVELHSGEYVKIVEGLQKELERMKAQLKERVVEKKAEPEICEKLNKLIDERRRLLNKMHNIESSEHIVKLRKQLKEHVDGRLSDLISDTPEKEQAHHRIGKTVSRFGRQEDTLKSEIATMKLQKLALENKTEELVKEHPELEKVAELENCKLEKTEAWYQSDLMQRKFFLLEEELKSSGTLLEKTCKMLQSCYLQLKGHNLAPNSLELDYQELVNCLQGRKSVTWESPVDSGLSSACSSSSTEVVEARPPKRKIEDENLPANSTFVLGSMPDKVKVCAEEIMSKVSRTPRSIKKRKDVVVQSMKERRGAGKIEVKKRPPFRT